MALTDYMFFSVNGEDTSTWFGDSNLKLAIISINGKGSFWERPFGRVDNLQFSFTMTLVNKIDLQPVPMVDHYETVCRKLFRKDDVKIKIYNQNCYYVGKFQGDKINSNYLHQSYFDIKFVCTKPYGFLDQRNETFRNTGTTEKTFTVNCISTVEDVEVRPVIKFVSKSSTNVKTYLINKTTGEKIEFDFTKASANEKLGSSEVITVDCKKKEITSNEDLNRYKFWNGEFLTLKYGDNTLGVVGNVEVQVSYVPTMRE